VYYGTRLKELREVVKQRRRLSRSNFSKLEPWSHKGFNVLSLYVTISRFILIRPLQETWVFLEYLVFVKTGLILR